LKEPARVGAAMRRRAAERIARELRILRAHLPRLAARLLANSHPRRATRAGRGAIAIAASARATLLAG
jgi:hypothetical protein